MILVAETLCHNLQKFLRILLIATDPRAEGIFEGLDKWPRRDGLLVDGPLIEPVQHLLECQRHRALLQFPDPVGALILTRGNLIRIRQLVVDLGSIELAPVQFADEVEAQFAQAREGLQDGVYKTVIGRIHQANDALFAPTFVRLLSINGKVGAEDVEEGDGGKRGTDRVGGDCGGLVGHRQYSFVSERGLYTSALQIMLHGMMVERLAGLWAETADGSKTTAAADGEDGDDGNQLFLMDVYTYSMKVVQNQKKKKNRQNMLLSSIQDDSSV